MKRISIAQPSAFSYEVVVLAVVASLEDSHVVFEFNDSSVRAQRTQEVRRERTNDCALRGRRRSQAKSVEHVDREPVRHATHAHFCRDVFRT